jgi:hypothetical protein
VWPDNETGIDLLGFDVLVDELVVALTDGRLLPLTVGVLGGWGSGKSSLLIQACEELRKDSTESPYVCVEFSPWKYEDYEDVKSALMRAVLNACQDRVGDDEAQVEEIGALRRFARNFGRRSRAAGRVVATAAPVVAPAVLAAVDPHAAQATISMTSGLVETAAPLANRILADKADSSEADPAADIQDVTEFHQRYAAMVGQLPGVDAVIVFIDDLDRCLPETIVDTFEAIRLFLNAPKTAYVIAANRQIIEAAIDSRYLQLQMDGGRKVGHEYLEKMLQLQVSVPVLSPVETATYVNLLVTELHLDSSDFATVCDSVRQRRAATPFAAVYNRQLSEHVLSGLMTAELAADLQWADDISPALADGLAGNPRSIKRFLNDLQWRQRAAARREVNLRPDVLAKLMVLEERHSEDLQTIFDWQYRTNGPSAEVHLAQALAHSQGDDTAPQEQNSSADTPSAHDMGSDQTVPTSISGQVYGWVNRPEIRRWLLLPPDLSEVDLRSYFTYFRDHIVVGSPAAALRPDLQALLSSLSSEAPAVARAAITAYTGLSQTDQDDLVLAFLDAVARRPDSTAFGTAAELAGRVPRLVPTVCDSLGRIPHTSLGVMRIPGVILRLPEGPERATLLAGWVGSSVAAVRSAAIAARRPPPGG